jgi:hypothetical protein
MDFDYMKKIGIDEVIDAINAEYRHKFMNRTRNKAGLHIHMSKEAFTTLHLYKFISFFNTHTDFIELIAGRQMDGYCRKFEAHGQGERHIKNFSKRKSGTHKYTMINLAPQHTVEVRVFAGVRSGHDFFVALEFLDALYYFTQQKSLKFDKTPEAFKSWVAGEGKRYGHLHSFLLSNNP